ncbi:MAG: hypothetical protein RLZZ156_496 [Deinococcota bacterium]|jgi:hypothetical protein
MSFLIEAGSGNYALPYAMKSPEELQTSITKGRTPGADNWHVVGDGRFDPVSLELKTRVRGTNWENSRALLNLLEVASRNATGVFLFSRYRRVVLKRESFTSQPNGSGYVVTIKFAPSIAFWLDTANSNTQVTL